jgi:hypothetical protein
MMLITPQHCLPFHRAGHIARTAWAMAETSNASHSTLVPHSLKFDA